jgi:hypothetical protein
MMTTAATRTFRDLDIVVESDDPNVSGLLLAETG